MIDWSQFINETSRLGPRSLLLKAMKYTTQNYIALDIGAGGLRETRYLLNHFREVHALDASEKTKLLSEKLRKKHKLKVFINDFSKFEYRTATYNLINSQFSLSYINPQYFKETFVKILKSLAPRGVFVGNFFGIRDAWNDGTHTDVLFLTIDEMKRLLKSTDIKHIKELEFKKFDKIDNTTANWHVIEFVVVKK